MAASTVSCLIVQMSASVFAVTVVHAMGIYMHLFAATTKYTWRGGEGFPGSDVRPL